MAVYDVFISHKSQDKEQLTKIENFLNQKGITFWSDSKMVQGLDWMRQIERGIQESKIMLYLLSQNVINDPDNIESEINLATQRRMKFVVVKLDDSVMEDYTGGFNLYLKKVQWINANNNVDNIFDSLYNAIKMQLSTNPQERRDFDTQMQQELAHLKRKQEQEYQKRVAEEVKTSILNMNMETVNLYLNQKKFTLALNKVNELLLTDSRWELLELKLKCLTKNYSDFSNKQYMEVFNQIREMGCPSDEYNRIYNEMNTSQKIAQDMAKKAKDIKEQQEKEAKKKELDDRLNFIKQKEYEIKKIKLEFHKTNFKRTFLFIILAALTALLIGILFEPFACKYLLMAALIAGIFACYTKNGFFSFLGYLAVFIGIPLIIFKYDNGITLTEFKTSYLYDILSNYTDLFGIDNISSLTNLTPGCYAFILFVIMIPYLICNYISIPTKKQKTSKIFYSLFLIIMAILVDALFTFVYLKLTNNYLDDTYIFIITMAALAAITIFSRNMFARGKWKKNEEFRKQYYDRLVREVNGQMMEKVNK